MFGLSLQVGPQVQLFAQGVSSEPSRKPSLGFPSLRPKTRIGPDSLPEVEEAHTPSPGYLGSGRNQQGKPPVLTSGEAAAEGEAAWVVGQMGA